MRKNIHIVVILLVAFLWVNVYSSFAQTNSYEGKITVEPVRLEQRGDFLFVDIDIVMNNVKVKSTQGVNLIPQLLSENESISLPMVSLKGGNQYKVYERSLSLMSKKEKEEYKEPYIVEKVNKHKNATIQYRYMLPYEEWMESAYLNVQYDVCGCGETALTDTEKIIDKITLEPLLVPYAVIPHMAYIQPKAEEVKSREIRMECFLDFEVNKVNIRPEYMNNPRELAKIRGMIDDLKNDPSIQVKRLDIIGFASPEGTLNGNKILSEGRAKALRDYLAARYEFPRNIYHIVFGGENWQGLDETLADYDMQYRDEVLALLKNTPDTEQRKQKLKQLRDGEPYRYMLRNIYPGLRVAICKVGYNIKNFDIDEAKEIIKKRPQNLSLNEMFLVANTYPSGSQEFIDVFETAVRMYPGDETANLNAAAAALTRNDLVSAERYLNRISSKNPTPEYNNIKGALALLKEDYDNAEIYLNAASKAGLEAAKLNLEELAKKKSNILEIEAKKINKGN